MLCCVNIHRCSNELVFMSSLCHHLSRNSSSNTFTIENIPVSGLWHVNYSFIHSIFFLKECWPCHKFNWPLSTEVEVNVDTVSDSVVPVWGEASLFVSYESHNMGKLAILSWCRALLHTRVGVSGLKICFALTVFPRTQCLLIHWPEPPRLYGLMLIKCLIFCFLSREF